MGNHRHSVRSQHHFASGHGPRRRSYRTAVAVVATASLISLALVSGLAGSLALFTGPAGAISSVGGVAAHYVQWDQQTQTFHTPPGIPDPLFSDPFLLKTTLDQKWMNAALAGAPGSSCVIQDQGGGYNPGRYPGDDCSGGPVPNNPFCQQAFAKVKASEGSDFQYFRSCTPQAIDLLGPIGGMSYFSTVHDRLNEDARPSLQVSNLGPNDLLIQYLIPCADPSVARTTKWATQYSNTMGYNHCAVDADNTSNNVGHPFFLYQRHCGLCSSGRVQIYADMEIDIELRVDPTFDPGANDPNTPFHVASATLNFSNAFVLPDFGGDQCHNDASLFNNGACLNAEASLNTKGRSYSSPGAKGDPIDLSSQISNQDVNASFHSSAPCPLPPHPTEPLLLCLAQALGNPVYGSLFDLTASFDDNGTLQVTFSRDVFPALSREKGPSVVADTGDTGSITAGIHIFGTDINGQIWEQSRTLQSFSQHWVNLGNPAPGIRASAPATYFSDAFGEAVLVNGVNNGHLYEGHANPNTGQWFWADHGPPPGTTGVSSPGVVIDPSGQEHAFVVGANGAVFVGHYNPNWKWISVGSPPNTTAVGSPAALATSAGFLGALITGANGKVEELSFNGAAWRWTAHGRPPGTSAATSVGATATTTNGVTLIYAFVTGANGVVQELADFAGTWAWQPAPPLGLLPNRPFRERPAAVTLTGSKSGAVDVFADDLFGHLVLFELQSGAWTATDLGVPPGTQVHSSPAAVVAADSTESAFAVGGNLHLGELTVFGWIDHMQL